MHFCVTLLCYSERQRGYPLNVQHALGGFWDGVAPLSVVKRKHKQVLYCTTDRTVMRAKAFEI